MQTVIMGLGNELLGDEGVGVHAVRQLKQYHLQEDVELVEVGTAILDSLYFFEHADRILIIDAMKDTSPPGSVYKISLNQCAGNHMICSMHGFDIFRVMALVERSSPPEVLVYGVEPELLEWSMELSDRVAKSIPYLLDAVIDELVPVLR